MYQIIIDVQFGTPVKGQKKHQVYFDVDNCKHITEDLYNATYDFKNKIENLAFIKPAFYPKVLIVTPKFNIRYTNWDTIDEAKSQISDYDIESRQFIVDEETYYVIVHEDDELSDLCLPLAYISEESFENPDMMFDEKDVITAQFDKPVYGENSHSLAFRQNSIYIDGANIEQTYEFNNDHSRLAVVKPESYPNVILITQTLKVRVTPWETLDEAYNMLEINDLVAYKISLDNGQNAYVVADRDEDISDMWVRCPEIERVEYVEDDPGYFTDGNLDAYVTKATARSIAYRACLYLNHKKGLKNLTPDEDDIDKYQEMFIKQSRKFLKIYSEMLGHAKSFVDSLSDEDCLRYFHDITKETIIDKFRSVYHDHLECKWMYNDYKEEDIELPNSGICTIENFYRMNNLYLYEMGLRLCVGCEKGWSLTKDVKVKYVNTFSKWNEDDLSLLRILHIKKKCDTSLIAQVFDKSESDVKYQIEHFL